MAKEIDAVTVAELLEKPITSTDLIPFSTPEGVMYRATAGDVAAIVLVEAGNPVFTNNSTLI